MSKHQDREDHDAAIECTESLIRDLERRAALAESAARRTDVLLDRIAEYRRHEQRLRAGREAGWTLHETLYPVPKKKPTHPNKPPPLTIANTKASTSSKAFPNISITKED